jgi:multidrug resistance efflux pump
MEKLQNDINLTNNEVKDILGTPPKWILRWGSLVLLLIMLIMVAGLLFIRRPEIIEGTVIVTPVKDQVQIVVPLNATIDSVFVKDGALVNGGDSVLTYRKSAKLYTVTAPEAGTISIEQLLAKGSVIDQDSAVINIDPAGQTYFVKGIFPGSAVNKIRPGQEIGINIDGYPKEDFGSLAATVINKPLEDSLYNTLINIKLNKNTTTEYGKRLPIRTLARGTGYMVISNERLIIWLLSK